MINSVKSSPMFIITHADGRDAWLNTLKSIPFPLVGFGVAYVINKAAHKIFNVEQKTTASNIIKTAAFLAGSATNFLLSPKISFVGFTGRKVLELFAVDMLVIVTLKMFCKKLILGPALGIGALSGWCGRRFTIPLSSLGAYCGAIAD